LQNRFTLTKQYIMSENKTSIRGIEQNRANQAYKFAEAGKALGGKTAKEYKAYVKRIPMIIKTNGLGATFAFVLAKGKRNKSNAYGLIYTQVTNWFAENRKYLMDIQAGEDLTEYIINLDSAKYRAVTVEVLALFQWMRRFAEGLITEDEGNNNQNQTA